METIECVCDEFGQHNLSTALFVYIIIFMTTDMHPPTNMYEYASFLTNSKNTTSYLTALWQPH